jgi:hypothetical protein
MFNRSVEFLSIVIAVLSLILFTTGCATLNESECKTANWEIIGYEDGSKGLRSDYIGEHRQACSEYRIAPDFDAYLTGHAKGLRQFCVPQNGFRQGNSGNANQQLCPADLASAFAREHDRGRNLYNMRQRVSSMKAELRSLESDYHAIENSKLAKEEELVSDLTTKPRRRELLGEIRHLEQDLVAIQYQIDEASRELSVLENRYQRMVDGQ